MAQLEQLARPVMRAAACFQKNLAEKPGRKTWQRGCAAKNGNSLVRLIFLQRSTWPDASKSGA
jgi:hypothetical protein